jgi:putative cell wall-binding protein
MFAMTSMARKAGVAAVAVATLSGLFFPSAALAAPAIAADLTLTALEQPGIGVGKAGQAAGDWSLDLTAGTTLTAGDQILITVDATGGSTCLAGDTLAFSSLPTVTVTGTATLVASIESTALGCGNDRLRLNVTGSGTAAVDVTAVAYTTGVAASVGPVVVDATFNGGAINDPAASNAFLSTVLVSGNNPPQGVPELNGSSFVISPVVISEQIAAGADGNVCIYFNDDIEDTPAPAPTVAVTGGSDTATLTVDTTTDSIFLDVIASGPATTSVFTISNIPIETDNNGMKEADLWADNADGLCDGDETVQLDLDKSVGFVGFVARYGGADRFTTAQIMFEHRFACADTVVIARADLFPDALASSYLAGHAGTGVLLTNTNSVPASTLNALRNEGVDNVYLMGGTSAISAAVATQLDATPAYECGGGPVVPAATLNVQRIGGVDRFETAQMAAEFPGLGLAGTLDTNDDGDCLEPAKTAIVASGLNFPDALAAGPLAYIGSPHDNCGIGPIPLLLSRTADVPSATLGALVNLGIENVVVVGGTAAVSDAALAQLTAAGYTVRRVAGANRSATAAALATAELVEWDFDTTDAAIARGDVFADALTGGPFAGWQHEPILLTTSPTTMSAETASLLTSWFGLVFNEVDFFEVFGGTGAVSAAVIDAALDAASQQ